MGPSVGGSTYSGCVFTDRERKGDFSQTLNAQGGALTLYDPFSTVVNGSAATRTAFPNNVIPASRLNQAGLAMAGGFPLPNISGATDWLGSYNWNTIGNQDNPARQVSERVDQIINDKHRVFVRFNWMKADRRYSNLPKGMLRAPIGGEPNDDLRNFYTLSLNTDHVFTPTLIGTMRLSYARYDSSTVFGNNFVSLKSLNLPDIIAANAAIQAWPRLDLGSNTITMGNRLKYRANDSYIFAPSAGKLFGSHTLRFGADLRAVSWNEISPDYYGAGGFSLSARFTQSDPFNSNTSKTTGASLAALVMGIPDSGSLQGSGAYALRSYYYAGYVQDEWKITRRLTLNLGLRYEVEVPYTERYNRLAYGFSYDATSPVQVPGVPLRGGLLYAGVDGNPRQEGKIDTNNFGPRLGIAYQIKPGLVFRGGYGLFYSSFVGNLDTGMQVPSTFNLNSPYVGTTDNGATPYTTLSNPFPNGLLMPSGNKNGLAAFYGQSLSFLAPNRVLPYNQQWYGGFQKSLPLKSRVELGFVRMLSLKGIETFNLNELPDKYLPLGADINKQVSNPFFSIFPSNVSLGSSKTVAQKQLWVAYPQYSSLNQVGSNTNTVVYHALQMNFEKRFSHGLSILGSYTLSKQMESNITSLVNTRHYRTISDTDRPSIFNIAWVYDLPVGPGTAFLNGRGLASRLLGGWTISGRAGIQAGQPLSITDANGRPYRLRNASRSGDIHSRLGDQVDAKGQVLNPYFDTTAFQSLPTQYMVSPEPPVFAELRAPGARTLDASLIKKFVIRERWRCEARMDASGALNHPIWAAPGTDMTNKSTFGVIPSASGSRGVQLAFRTVF